MIESMTRSCSRGDLLKSASGLLAATTLGELFN
jgi:hypothetical protein